MRFLDYFFFKFHNTILRVEGDKGNYINAYIGVAAMLFLNINTIVYFLGLDLGIGGLLAVLLVLVGLSYLTFVKNKRYKKIFARYSEKDPYPVFGKIMIISYIVITTILFFISLNIARERNIEDVSELVDIPAKWVMLY